MKLTQKDILSEGFWSNIAAPLRVAGGVAGAAVKGGASLLRKVAPEITNPLDRLEADARDVGEQMRQGYDIGSGGLKKAFSDILLDSGYLLNVSGGIVRTGKNKIVTGWRIIGRSKTSGKPIGDKTKLLSFIFDKNNQFKIVNTSAQQTTRSNNLPSQLNVSKTGKHRGKIKKP